MKRLAIVYPSLLLVLNFIAGLILDSYLWFNVVTNSLVLLFTIFIGLWISKSNISKYFRLSLSFIIPILTLGELACGCLMPPFFRNNWVLLIITLLVIIEIAIIFTIYRVSNKNKKSK